MLPVKARRNPVPLSLGVGGGAGVVIPPDTVYSKPPAHAIYYASTFPDSAVATLAKYSSVTIATANTSSLAVVKAGINAIRALNPSIKLINYNILSEASFPSIDSGGTYGNPSAKLAAADWLLRNAANDFYITYGSGDGTFLPDRGAWVSSTSYAVNDVVLQGGIYYKCLTANSDVSFTGAKWTTSLGVMAVNFCKGVLPDHLGVSWPTYFARACYTQASRSGCTWDGVYMDLHGYPDDAVPLDWENTGANVLARDTASVKRKMEDSIKDFVAELTVQFGAGMKILGNTNGNIAPYNLLTEYVTTRGMSAYADGWLHESTIAPSINWSFLCIGGVSGAGNTVMGSGWSIKAQQVRDPVNSYSVLGIQMSKPTDYATMRMGIALALYQNSRPALTPPAGYASTSPIWADELDQLIGAGIDAVQSAAVSGNIWKRRFQNGVILLNEAKLAIGTNRGAWAAGVSYTQGQYVTQAGNVRVCRYGQGHTSSGSFATDDAAGRWHSMTSTAAPGWIAGAPVTIDSSIIPYGIYRRFSGTQDPVQNSGAVVSGSFSLAGWDAILLLCVTPGVHS